MTLAAWAFFAGVVLALGGILLYAVRDFRK